MFDTREYRITADRQVIGHGESESFRREAWNRQFGDTLCSSNVPTSNRYNHSRQGANDCYNLTEKAWLRWAGGKVFDSSDESFYPA